MGLGVVGVLGHRIAGLTQGRLRLPLSEILHREPHIEVAGELLPVSIQVIDRVPPSRMPAVQAVNSR